MPKLFKSYRYDGTAVANAYEADDARLFSLRSRFVVPPDITNAGADAIVAAIPGALPVLPTDTASICPEPGLKGRKLIFTRSNGSSMSFTIGSRLNASLDAARVAIETAINANGAFDVACVALEGEYFPNLYDIYVPPAKAGITPFATGNRPPAAAGIQYYYGGTFNYQTDHTPFASVRILPFKIASDVLLPAVPTLWAGVIDAAPFNLIASPLNGCGGSDPREPRHFVVTNAIGAALATALPQKTKIPVGVAAAASVQAAGVALATLGSTYCLEYRGESNSRFYRA
jgi:hypothetical protein